MMIVEQRFHVPGPFIVWLLTSLSLIFETENDDIPLLVNSAKLVLLANLLISSILPFYLASYPFHVLALASWQVVNMVRSLCLATFLSARMFAHHHHNRKFMAAPMLALWSLNTQCQWCITLKDFTLCRGLKIWWLINMVMLNQFSTHRNPLPAFIFGWGGRVMVGIYMIVYFMLGHYQGDHSFIQKTSQKKILIFLRYFTSPSLSLF